MRKYVLTTITFLCLVVGAAAQDFFNLTANEVKIDSMLPCFTHQRPLGANYADSVYEVSIEYPEFVDMSPTDIARYQRLTDSELPEMPVVRQTVSTSRKQGVLDISFVPLVKRDGRYQKLVSFMLKVRSAAASHARGMRRAASASERYAAHSVLASGRWVKISIPETGVYQLTDNFIRRAGFSNPSKVKLYGYGGALQPEALTGDYLTQTDDLKELPTYEVNGRRLFFGTRQPTNCARATTIRPWATTS